jgi:hypothetical protein
MKTKLILSFMFGLIVAAGCSTSNAAEAQKSIASMATISSREVSTDKEQFVSVTKDGTFSRIPVSIFEHHVRASVKTKGGETREMDFVLIEVRSKEKSKFSWSCAEIRRPHGFKIFPAPGVTHVAYVDGSGIRLFVVKEPNTQESALDRFLQSENQADSWLPVGLFLDTHGKEFETKDALRTPIEIADITEEKGVVYLTIHGNDPGKKHTFALEGGVWKLSKQP